MGEWDAQEDESWAELVGSDTVSASTLCNLRDLNLSRMVSKIGHAWSLHAHGIVAGLGPALQRVAMQLRIPSQGLSRIIGLEAMPNLERLVVAFNDLDKLPAVGLCSRLGLLNASHNRLVTLELTANEGAARLGDLPLLTSLDVSHNRLRSLAGIEGAGALHRLVAAPNPLDDLRGLASALASLPVLATLALPGAACCGAVRDPEAAHAMIVSSCRSLSTLVLASPPVRPVPSARRGGKSSAGAAVEAARSARDAPPFVAGAQRLTQRNHADAAEYMRSHKGRRALGDLRTAGAAAQRSLGGAPPVRETALAAPAAGGGAPVINVTDAHSRSALRRSNAAHRRRLEATPPRVPGAVTAPRSPAPSRGSSARSVRLLAEEELQQSEGAGTEASVAPDPSAGTEAASPGRAGSESSYGQSRRRSRQSGGGKRRKPARGGRAAAVAAVTTDDGPDATIAAARSAIQRALEGLTAGLGAGMPAPAPSAAQRRSKDAATQKARSQRRVRAAERARGGIPGLDEGGDAAVGTARPETDGGARGHGGPAPAVDGWACRSASPIQSPARAGADLLVRYATAGRRRGGAATGRAAADADDVTVVTAAVSPGGPSAGKGGKVAVRVSAKDGSATGLWPDGSTAVSVDTDAGATRTVRQGGKTAGRVFRVTVMAPRVFRGGAAQRQAWPKHGAGALLASFDGFGAGQVSDAATGRPLLVARADGSGSLADPATGKEVRRWGADGTPGDPPRAAACGGAAGGKPRRSGLADAVSGLDAVMAALGGAGDSQPAKAAPPPAPAEATRTAATGGTAPGGVVAFRLLPGLYLSYEVERRAVVVVLRCKGLRHAFRLGRNSARPGGHPDVPEELGALEREDMELAAEVAEAAREERTRSPPREDDPSDPATLAGIRSKLAGLLQGLAIS